jgi:hypothetical protein
MKHLGTSSSHAEASRGGSSSRRPGAYPHRAGVKARAEHGNSLETTPALRRRGLFRPLSGGVTRAFASAIGEPTAEPSRHPSAVHPNPQATTHRAALDPKGAA